MERKRHAQNNPNRGDKNQFYTGFIPIKIKKLKENGKL